MTILIVLLTIALILDCLLLGLLILVQLPKKEAGIGMAFGGGAADALFGAGSGNVLSKLTRNTAIAFFALVFVLSFVNKSVNNRNGSELRGALQRTATSPAPAPAVPAPAAAPVIPAPSAPAQSGGIPLLSTNTAAPTPAPSAPAGTNSGQSK